MIPLFNSAAANPMDTKIFLHGLESSNMGTKSVFFREHFPDMLTPNFTGSLEKRMKKLYGILDDRSELIIVGSSFGGLMASVFAMNNESVVKKLILLAPAINLLYFSRYEIKRISLPVNVYHGKNDEVIPAEAVKKVAEHCFDNLSLNVVEDDHSLHHTFKGLDWHRILYY